MKRRVLFLCTGNSCRSQIAEAIVRHDLGETWDPVSAGTRPAGYVHPKALAVLAEIGIDHTGRSKGVDEFRGADLDWVITVCDSAAEECPVWLGKGKKTHMGFPDPVRVLGTEAEVMAAFRKTRDDIRRTIVPALRSLPGN
jgi:arsenate reductase